jgi:hypothetical protein
MWATGIDSPTGQSRALMYMHAVKCPMPVMDAFCLKIFVMFAFAWLVQLQPLSARRRKNHIYRKMKLLTQNFIHNRPHCG